MAGDALIGRDEELALLGTLRDSGAAAGVVIVRPAGVGKTALARRFVSEVEADGASSSWIVATRSLATIPFGAFAPLLPPMGGSLRLEADTFTRAIAAMTARPGLVLGVDDAHLLDPGSAALLHQLARARR